MLTPYAAASVLGARLALRLAAWLSEDLLLPLGCVCFGAANLGLALFHGHLWQLAAVLLVGGIGSGMTFNSIPWLLLRHVPDREIASATGFNLVLRFLGMSSGSAVALTILDLTSPPGAQAGSSGYTTGGLVGLTISVVAAVCCVALSRTRRPLGQREHADATSPGLVASSSHQRED